MIPALEDVQAGRAQTQGVLGIGTPQKSKTDKVGSLERSCLTIKEEREERRGGEYTVLDPLKYTEAANRDPGPWGFFQLPWNSDQVLSFLHGCGERYTDQGL